MSMPTHGKNTLRIACIAAAGALPGWSALGADEPAVPEDPFRGRPPAVHQAPPPSQFASGHRLSGPTLFHWSGVPTAPPDPTEEDVLVTDRPDFTEAASTVGRGRLQIEAGYTFFHDEESGTEVETHSYPETLYRIGLFEDWFELRIAYNFLEEEIDDPLLGQTRLRGSDDLYLGAKIALTEQAGWLPEMAVIPQMFVPTGDSDFTNDEVLPGVNWLYAWEVNEWLSVGGSTQVNRVRDETGHFYAEVAQSAAMGVSLTDRWGAYGEYFGLYPNGAVASGVGPEHFLNGGVTYLVNNNLQLDVRSGFGLNSNAADFFTGAGLSVRF